jgi:hypothetical protein
MLHNAYFLSTTTYSTFCVFHSEKFAEKLLARNANSSGVSKRKKKEGKDRIKKKIRA